MQIENKNDMPDITADEQYRVDFDLTLGDTTHHIYFRSNTPALALTPEARIAAALWPSMVSGQAYREDEPLDARFLASLSEIQDIITTWQPQLSPIDLSLYRSVNHGPVHMKDREATFFSGGLDSFYTLLKNRETVTDIIFIQGLDIQLTDQKLMAEATRTVQRVGKEFGKNVITVETNIRTITDKYIGWGFAHGAVLASVGHLLSGILGTIHIPASHTYTKMFPWGSHPLLDPLWSSRTLEFIHDGAEADRLTKIKAVAQSQLARETLRVCWMNYNNAYNCCRCEKCQRTMINMRIAGVLDDFPVFPEKLHMENIRALKITSTAMETFLQESLAAVREKGTDPELEKALSDLLRGQNLFQKAFNALRRAISQPGRILPALKRRLGLGR